MLNLRCPAFKIPGGRCAQSMYNQIYFIEANNKSSPITCFNYRPKDSIFRCSWFFFFPMVQYMRRSRTYSFSSQIKIYEFVFSSFFQFMWHCMSYLWFQILHFWNHNINSLKKRGFFSKDCKTEWNLRHTSRIPMQSCQN